MDGKFFSGVFLGCQSDIELSEEFKNFLALDEQGIEGLEFMLQDPKLTRRIPHSVRMEYEILYGQISQSIEEQISIIREELDKIEKNPKPVIHNIIGDAYNRSEH